MHSTLTVPSNFCKDMTGLELRLSTEDCCSKIPARRYSLPSRTSEHLNSTTADIKHDGPWRRNNAERTGPVSAIGSGRPSSFFRRLESSFFRRLGLYLSGCQSVERSSLTESDCPMSDSDQNKETNNITDSLSHHFCRSRNNASNNVGEIEELCKDNSTICNIAKYSGSFCNRSHYSEFGNSCKYDKNSRSKSSRSGSCRSTSCSGVNSSICDNREDRSILHERRTRRRGNSASTAEHSSPSETNVSENIANIYESYFLNVAAGSANICSNCCSTNGSSCGTRLHGNSRGYASKNRSARSNGDETEAGKPDLKAKCQNDRESVSDGVLGNSESQHCTIEKEHLSLEFQHKNRKNIEKDILDKNHIYLNQHDCPNYSRKRRGNSRRDSWSGRSLPLSEKSLPLVNYLSNRHPISVVRLVFLLIVFLFWNSGYESQLGASAEIIFHRRDHRDQGLYASDKRSLYHVENYNEAMVYLSKYGYLDNCTVEPLRSKRQAPISLPLPHAQEPPHPTLPPKLPCTRLDVERGMKKLQKTFELRPSGRLDRATKSLMSRGRCGNSDTSDLPVPIKLRRFIDHGRAAEYVDGSEPDATRGSASILEKIRQSELEHIGNEREGDNDKGSTTVSSTKDDVRHIRRNSRRKRSMYIPRNDLHKESILNRTLNQTVISANGAITSSPKSMTLSLLAVTPSLETMTSLHSSVTSSRNSMTSSLETITTSHGIVTSSRETMTSAGSLASTPLDANAIRSEMIWETDSIRSSRYTDEFIRSNRPTTEIFIDTGANSLATETEASKSGDNLSSHFPSNHHHVTSSHRNYNQHAFSSYELKLSNSAIMLEDSSVTERLSTTEINSVGSSHSTVTIFNNNTTTTNNNNNNNSENRNPLIENSDGNSVSNFVSNTDATITNHNDILSISRKSSSENSDPNSVFYTREQAVGPSRTISGEVLMDLDFSRSTSEDIVTTPGGLTTGSTGERVLTSSVTTSSTTATRLPLSTTFTEISTTRMTSQSTSMTSSPIHASKEHSTEKSRNPDSSGKVKFPYHIITEGVTPPSTNTRKEQLIEGIKKHENRQKNESSSRRMRSRRNKRRSVSVESMGDITEGEDGLRTKFNKDENSPVNWRLLEDNLSGKIPLTDQRAILELAFRMWSEVIPLKFHEETGLDIRNMDVIIGFAKQNHMNCDKPFDGHGGELAHSWTAGDIHFDEDENYKRESGSGSGINLLKVAVHEIGHVLGLLHNEHDSSIMYPVYVNPAMYDDFELSRADRIAVQKIYGLCKGTFDVAFDWLRKLPSNEPTRKWRYIFNTYFFRDVRYWMYENKYNRTRYGDPLYIDRGWTGLEGPIDAFTQVITSTEDGQEYIIDTYFFKGDQYYKYEDDLDHVAEGYPKLISEGFGPKAGNNESIPNDLDSVLFDNRDSLLYFFKGEWVWVYNPRDIGQHGCCERKVKFTSLFPTISSSNHSTTTPVSAHVTRSAPALEDDETQVGEVLKGSVDAVFYSYHHNAVFFFKGEAVYRNVGFNEQVPGRNLLRRQDYWFHMWHDICDVE